MITFFKINLKIYLYEQTYNNDSLKYYDDVLVFTNINFSIYQYLVTFLLEPLLIYVKISQLSW